MHRADFLPPQDIDKTRRDQLQRLINDLGGRPNLVKAVEMSKYGDKPVISSRILSGIFGKRKDGSWMRAFGTDICRRLEKTLGLESDYFDTPAVTKADLTLPQLPEPAALTALTTHQIPAPPTTAGWDRLPVPAPLARANRFLMHWHDDTMTAGTRSIASTSNVIICLDSSVRSGHIVLAALDGALLLREYVRHGPKGLLLTTSERYGPPINLADVGDVHMARALLALTEL